MRTVELEPRSGPLVGRSEELRLVAQLADRLHAGAGTFLAISGESGIGKSRLLAELAALCDDRLAAARGEGPVGAAPFETVAAALDPYLAGLPDRRLDADHRALLAGVFDTFQQRGEPVIRLETERWRHHRAVRDLLVRLGRDEPLLVALDDVHDADVATTELLAYLLRREPPPGIGVALALRRPQTSETLRHALDEAQREGILVRVELTPLSEDAADELVGPGFDGAMRKLLYERSAGNPLFLKALADELRGSDDRRPRLPPGIRAPLESRVVGLAPRTRALAEGGSVLGHDFSIDVAAEVVGLDEAAALAAYDELALSDVVVSGSAGRVARFLHPLMRSVIYDAIDADDRRLLHARAAALLRKRGAATGAVAYHVEHSADPGDDDAIELLASAGRDAAIRAPAQAARWFAAARKLLTPDTPAARRTGVLLALARSLATSGQLRESQAVLRATLTDATADERATAVMMIAENESLRGRDEDCQRILTTELDRSSKLDRVDACMLRVSLAISLSRASHRPSEPALAHANEALRQARDRNDPALVFAALAGLTLVHFRAARVEQANAVGDDALAEAERLTDAQLAPHLGPAAALGHVLGVERFPQGSAIMERGLAVARATAQVAHYEPMLAGLASTRFWQGRLTQAAELAEETLETGLLVHNEVIPVWAPAIQAQIALARGDIGAALAFSAAGERYLEEHPAAGGQVFAWIAHMARGMSLLDAGRPAAARRALDDGGPDYEHVMMSMRPVYLCELARAELALHDLSAARAWTDRAEAVAAPLGLPGRVAYVQRVRAQLELADGKPRRAAELAEAATGTHVSLDMLVQAVRDQLVAAEALRRIEDHEAAEVRLRHAHVLATDTGATRLRTEAEQALARLGRRAPAARGRRAADDVALLTANERRVALLLASGRSNSEIAAELCISDRSVERYITRVRRKLGAGSRSAVAAIVASRRDDFSDATH